MQTWYWVEGPRGFAMFLGGQVNFFETVPPSFSISKM